MGRREHHGLFGARGVLRKDVHQVAEVAGKLAGAHRGAHFKSALERHRFHIETFLFEESFAHGHIEHDGVGRRKRGDAQGFGRSHRAGRGQKRADERFQSRLKLHGILLCRK